MLLIVACKTTSPFSVKVTFDGLVAFVPDKVDGQPVLWALLPNADYNPDYPNEAVLPPCVYKNATSTGAGPSFFPTHYPPHLAAMRIKNASVTLNGEPMETGFSAFLLQGRDLRIDTHRKVSRKEKLEYLAVARQLKDTMGGSESDYLTFDKVNPAYIREDLEMKKYRDLAARVLIDFGDQIEDEPETCPKKQRDYGFQPPAGKNCTPKAKVKLSERVTVKQDGLRRPITLRLLPSKDVLTIAPDEITTNREVAIEILNITPNAISDPYYKPCEEHPHLETFRWFYRLLATQTSDPQNCSDNYYPCDPGANPFGGTKCPQKGLIK